MVFFLVTLFVSKLDAYWHHGQGNGYCAFHTDMINTKDPYGLQSDDEDDDLKDLTIFNPDEEESLAVTNDDDDMSVLNPSSPLEIGKQLADQKKSPPPRRKLNFHQKLNMYKKHRFALLAQEKKAQDDWIKIYAEQFKSRPVTRDIASGDRMTSAAKREIEFWTKVWRDIQNHISLPTQKITTSSERGAYIINYQKRLLATRHDVFFNFFLKQVPEVDDRLFILTHIDLKDIFEEHYLTEDHSLVKILGTWKLNVLSMDDWDQWAEEQGIKDCSDEEE